MHSLEPRFQDKTCGTLHRENLKVQSSEQYRVMVERHLLVPWRASAIVRIDIIGVLGATLDVCSMS